MTRPVRTPARIVECHEVTDLPRSSVARTVGINPDNVLVPLQVASSTRRIAGGPRAGRTVLSLHYASRRVTPMEFMQRLAGASAEVADKLVQGVYPCYSLSGTALNYMFMDIQIDGPTTYRDTKGRKGSYQLEVATGTIVFESGPLTNANAKLLSGPKIGLNMDGGSFFNTTCSLKK